MRVSFDVVLSAQEGQTALHMAAQFGHLDVIGELLLNRCDASTPDAGGWTAARVAEEEQQHAAEDLLKQWESGMCSDTAHAM